MAIYAISDLHLSFDQNKPMSVFGEIWENHVDKIKENWIKQVKEEDLVLLPGDFSWAMRLEDTFHDFSFLQELPGEKVLLKGNHDYWWNTLTKMRKFLQENQFSKVDFLYNNSYCKEDTIVVGTRGWTLGDNDEENTRILKREVERLKLSLEDGIKKYGTEKEILVCMHYPPLKDNQITDFVKVMMDYPVKKCIYGHLHGVSQRFVVEGEYYGIDFKMVSCDYTNFKLIKIV